MIPLSIDGGGPGKAMLVAVSAVLVGTCLCAAYPEKIVLVYCRDDTMPLGYREMMKFSSALAGTIQAGLGEDFEVYACTSMSELQHFLMMPQVVALVSSYVGSHEHNLTLPFERYFRDGMGIVGFNQLCSTEFAGDLACSVFPVFGNASTLGSMTFIDGEWIRMRTYAKAGQHAIAEGLPNELTIPDYQINFCLRSDNRHAEGWPLPTEGSYFLVFTTVGRDSPYQDKMLPGVIAYDNEGRSVSFPGFYASELAGISSYERFVNEALFMRLVSNAVAWASQSGVARSDRMAASFNQSLEDLKARLEAENNGMEAWVSARSSRRAVTQATILAAGALGIILVGYLTFFSGRGE